MRQAGRGPAVIDTGVFGARLTHRTRPLAAAYRPLREGRPAIISFVAVAELRFGATLAGWGPASLQRLEHELGQADTVWPGSNLADTYATLRAWCVKAGARAWPQGARGGPLGGRDGSLARRPPHRP